MHAHIPDLRSLEVIIAIADHGSFGAASRALGLTQQGVSERVKQAERAVGATLFDRTPRGARPTDIGHAIITAGRDVLVAADRLGDDIAQHKDPDRIRLQCAASQTIANHYLPRWIGTMHQQHPGLSFRICASNSADITDAVARGQYPLGFIESTGIPAEGAAQVNSSIIGIDELGVVVSDSHPWAGRVVSPEELLQTPLITREQGSGTRDVVEQALGCPLHSVILECDTLATTRQAVMALNAPAILPLNAVREELQAGVLARCVVADLTFKRHLRAIWHRGTTLRGPTRQLVDIAHSYLAAPAHQASALPLRRQGGATS